MPVLVEGSGIFIVATAGVVWEMGPPQIPAILPRKPVCRWFTIRQLLAVDGHIEACQHGIDRIGNGEMVAAGE